MKKIAIGVTIIMGVIAIASITMFSKPRPTHNPFDNVFNVSIEGLLDEGYEFSYGSCGYNSYRKFIDGSDIYYQEYSEQPGDILAKGAYITLDTLCRECVINTQIIEDTTRPGLAPLTEGVYQCAAVRDSLYFSLKPDRRLITERLKPFQVSLIDTSFKLDKYGYSFYVKHIPSDSIFFCELTLTWNCIREINMQQGNPQPFSQNPFIKFISSLFTKEQDGSEVGPENKYAEE